jgi:DNA invertase Pin-like site-specific DNA recombinase
MSDIESASSPVRAAIYACADVARPHPAGFLQRQEARLRAEISRHPNWLYVARYRDRVRGMAIERPGLSLALADAGFGHFNLLLVESPDRLGWLISLRSGIITAFAGAGVELRFLQPAREVRIDA